jgi:hypothetical protein
MAKEDMGIYAAMQSGSPLAVYKKSIVGKVHVIVLNPFTDKPEGVILEGLPARADQLDAQIVELWDPKSKLFFERMNKKHIDAGRLSLVKRETLPDVPQSPNVISDEEIDELLEAKFLALKARLDKFTTEAPVFRLLNRARDLEKSEKIIHHIEERLSQFQLSRYETPKEE